MGTNAPALVITDDMRRRYYAALAAAEAAYVARTAPAREHRGLSDTVRRGLITLTAHARMHAANR